ncbi:MAG TPA: DinB family protein, partial [Flavisolibacter sp.]|nr:DinB family protein [Flavisolibacter sp.]
KQIILAAEHLRQADAVKLSYPPAEGQWSVAQVLEHLNAYSRYYLPLIEKSIVTLSKDVDAWFIPGFFGNYFTKMMMPKNVFEIKNRMKASKAFCPPRGLHVETVFQEFIEHQNKLIQLLEVSKRRNLNKIHIPIALTSLIRFRLGDAFRFLVAHEQRHMIQARNAIKTLGITTDKFPVILEAARL